MKSFAQFASPSLHAIGPTALLAVAVVATFLLGRRRRPVTHVRLLHRWRLRGLGGVTLGVIIGAMPLIALLTLGNNLQGRLPVAVLMLSLVTIGFIAAWIIQSRMLASILVMVFRNFEIGDRIEIAGDEAVLGEVTGLNPLSTTLRTEDGGTLHVPNHLFLHKVLKRHAPAAFACPRPSPV